MAFSVHVLALGVSQCPCCISAVSQCRCCDLWDESVSILWFFGLVNVAVTVAGVSQVGVMHVAVSQVLGRGRCPCYRVRDQTSQYSDFHSQSMSMLWFWAQVASLVQYRVSLSRCCSFWV